MDIYLLTSVAPRGGAEASNQEADIYIYIYSVIFSNEYIGQDKVGVIKLI